METMFEVFFKLLVSISGAVLVFGGMLIYVLIQIPKGETK